MSDTPLNPAFAERTGSEPDQGHQPKHRLEGVPYDAQRDADSDAQRGADADIARDFGQNPDTSLAG